MPSSAGMKSNFGDYVNFLEVENRKLAPVPSNSVGNGKMLLIGYRNVHFLPRIEGFNK